MANGKTHAEKILALARRKGVVSAREVREMGIHHEYLRRLCADGRLRRVARGLYELPRADVTAHHSLALAARAVPKGVICLISALAFHEIGTQTPHEVWMAIDRRSAEPRVKRPQLRIVRFSGEAMTEGIEEHVVEGVPVPIYSVAKTVADCFKYRNKLGLDVALEALREVLRLQKCSVDELQRYAEICRVSTVIRPYMEAMV
ncbi:MAG: type IV toxin-antitoxin system AbiEi family antitoxin domain-containing protein [Candidatus Brocadiia bacterium]